MLEARTALHITEIWDNSGLQSLGWLVLSEARRVSNHSPAWERVLDEADGLLLRLLDRLPVLVASSDSADVRARTFLVPALERLQHATAAALVARRYGVAGLRTVIADQEAPLARRYFAFLGLAEVHPPHEWPVFARYLHPRAHHAFQGAAAEAARFYPAGDAAAKLMELFDAVRTDLHLRAFLSPRILESLYVLAAPATLPFFRELLTAGFTDQDPERCEVTRALVMVRRLTGALEPNIKYRDIEASEVAAAVDVAETAFDRARGVLTPVTVI